MRLGLAFLAIAFCKVMSVFRLFWNAATGWRGKGKDQDENSYS